MSPVYSRTGCNRCKLRKKKCGEERPVCRACAKWNWSCSYEPGVSKSHVRSAVTSNQEGLGPQLSKDLLLPSCCNDENENRLLRGLPDSVATFYSPASGYRIKDLQVMWQLMVNNSLLRHALTACFSTMAKDPGILDHLHQKTYGKALQSLRSKVLCSNLDVENFLCVVASVVFLGKMESFGPHLRGDPLQHWMGVISLLGNNSVAQWTKRGLIPFSENMLIFESLLYHVGTHAMFSRSVYRAWSLWQANGIYLRLCNLNPEGPERLSCSPLLSGQYELYHMALQMTHLLHSTDHGFIASEMADDLEASVNTRDLKLGHDFATMDSPTMDSVKLDVEREIYHFFCNSLHICITMLREPCKSQRKKMEQLVRSGLEMFLALPVYGDEVALSRHANHFMLAAIWPIQIQGCAVYDAEQFQIFQEHYSRLEQSLDPGHWTRARCLMGKLSEMLESLSVNDEENALPAGLSLLRRVIETHSAVQEL